MFAKLGKMNKKKLYTFIIPHYYGSSLSLLHIIKSLDREKYVPTVVFLGGDDEIIPLFKKKKLKLLKLREL